MKVTLGEGPIIPDDQERMIKAPEKTSVAQDAGQSPDKEYIVKTSDELIEEIKKQLEEIENLPYSLSAEENVQRDERKKALFEKLDKLKSN
jgi:hypothetical protein